MEFLKFQVSIDCGFVSGLNFATFQVPHGVDDCFAQKVYYAKSRGQPRVGIRRPVRFCGATSPDQSFMRRAAFLWFNRRCADKTYFVYDRGNGSFQPPGRVCETAVISPRLPARHLLYRDFWPKVFCFVEPAICKTESTSGGLYAHFVLRAQASGTLEYSLARTH